jgi:hypothetical protein
MHRHHSAAPSTTRVRPVVYEYRWNEANGHFIAEAVTVLTLEGALIGDITAFRYPKLFDRVGLPEQL